ncbi:unnamed protein product, partial [Rotaria sp. Silwood2]
VDYLCDHLQSTTGLKEQEDILYELKVLSEKCKGKFDIKNINLLTNIIKDNRADLRLIELALEILTNVITYDVTINQEQSGLTQDTVIQFI